MSIFVLVSHSPGAEHTRISTKVGQNTSRKNIHVIKMRKKKNPLCRTWYYLQMHARVILGVMGSTGNGGELGLCLD